MKCSICERTLDHGERCYVLTYCIVMEDGDYERREDAEVYCLDCASKLNLDQPSVNQGSERLKGDVP
jgi:hypothetical protein